MKLKLSQIATAIGVLAVATSASADPIGPNRPIGNYAAGTSDVFIAGSSAVDLALTKFIGNACAAGSLDVYRTDAGGKTYYLWTCESAAGANFNLTSGNTKIAIHKNTNSSSDGVNGVANGAGNFAFLQVADLNGAASNCAIAPTVVPATPNIPAYNLYVCGTTAGAAGVGTLNSPTTFGFADSEPAQFNAAVASQLTSAYPLSIVFGIPVTKNVRDLLQTAQGLVTGSETEANMPNLTVGQINGIFTGRFTTWATAAGITVPGGDNSVYKVRRSNGSGTTRAFDATFVSDFCVPGLAPIATGTTLVTATIPAQCNSVANGGTKSLQAGTSDDMAACVASFQTNGAVGGIGYLSTDYLPGAGDLYRWVKIEGYSPKILNVANGNWKDWSEESLNYNTGTGIAGDNLAFYNTIKATSANGGVMSDIEKAQPQTTSGMWTGAIMGALPGSKNQPGWGLPAGASLTVPRTDASVLAYPANPFTRATTAGYNLCAPAFPASGYAAE